MMKRYFLKIVIHQKSEYCLRANKAFGGGGGKDTISNGRKGMAGKKVHKNSKPFPPNVAHFILNN